MEKHAGAGAISTWLRWAIAPRASSLSRSHVLLQYFAASFFARQEFHFLASLFSCRTRHPEPENCRRHPVNVTDIITDARMSMLG